MPAASQESKQKDQDRRDIRPPNAPWVPLKTGTGSRSAMSFYYSDPLSQIPVRDVSNRNDPKTDPNFETLTFGLFSNCDKRMRATIVREGIGFHFFCTMRSTSRVLTGYYQIGWYSKIPGRSEDYALAAREARFVSPGFPLQDLTPYLWGVKIGWFRTYRYIDGETANRLLLLLKDAPDATHDYISEIHRLEQLSLKKNRQIYKGKYPNGLDWSAAFRPLKPRS